VSEEAPGVVSVHRRDQAEALIATGAVLERHAHQMRLRLPVPAPPTAPDIAAEFRPFTPDAEPPVPWADVLPAFLTAYPPGHPDHLEGGETLVDQYLVPYTRGARLGPLLCSASAIAVRAGRAYGGILVVDRPGEGPWVCDVWRDPDPRYAGTGTALVRWAAQRLEGWDSLGLVVTVGNEAALRSYQRAGFAIETTAWRLRLPGGTA